MLSIEQIAEVAANANWLRGDNNETSKVVSFTKDGSKINVWYTTGTVGTCIDHPTQNKTQLFRKGIATEANVETLKEIFSNPRTHTGVGYQRVAYDASRQEDIGEEAEEISAQISRIDEQIEALKTQRRELTNLVRQRKSRSKGRRRSPRSGSRVVGRGRVVASEHDSQPSTVALFAGNLGFGADEEQLRALFEGHAPQRVHIARRDDGRSKGFGFAVFGSEAEQQAALDALQGAPVPGSDPLRQVKLEVATKGGELSPEQRAALPREAPAEHQEVPRFHELSVFVGNLPRDIDDEALRAIFEGGGLDIERTRVVPRRGYGFVKFSSEADQQRALEKSGTSLGDNEIVVQITTH